MGSTWGATPKLMARGKIMKAMNEERKPEKIKKRKQQRDRQPTLNEKLVMAGKIK